MSDAFAEVWAAVAGVDGWLTEGQATMLFKAAAAVPDGGSIVEIGSFHGRSTIVIARSASASTRITAIDPHAGNDRGPQEIDGYVESAADDHRRFNDNLAAAGVGDRVTHIREFSDAAAAAVHAPIDMLYIDGAHRYAPAAADISGYGAKVAEGGTMLIHDSFSSIGVTAAIGRHLLLGTRFRYLGRSRSLTAYRRETLHGRQRLVNAARQLAQLPWFVGNVGLKVLLSAGAGRIIGRITGRPVEWPY